MSETQIVVDRDFVIDAVSPRLYGSFLEHLGRAVYGGVYEPGHPQAGEDGIRLDVLALVKEMGVTVLRYPGGNFVSGYRWEDGVGPKAQRPRRRDLAWLSTESNQFGTDEFIRFCRQASVEPMLAVNLGTRGCQEAGDYYEYCNHSAGTALSDLRRAHGSPSPYDVRLWCLGNEADGPWQMGQRPAEEYGRTAREAVKLMASPDQNRTGTPLPRDEFIACGSCGRGMSTYGRWDQTVLDQCFEKVDYLSVHSYVSPRNQELAAFLAFADTTMAPLIREVSAICDAVAATRKSSKRIHLSYDEWNVWYFNPDPPFEPWAEAPPLLEDQYTLSDALCVGAMLITLLNHCDRVKIACQAQLVNVIAPIMTRRGGPAWRQTIFHPFALTSRFGRGKALRQVIHGPTYSVEKVDVPTVLTSIVFNDDGGLTVFAVNRDLVNPQPVRITARGFGPMKPIDWQLLADADLSASNTEANPDRVRPRSHAGADAREGKLSFTLPAASWSVIRFAQVN